MHKRSVASGVSEKTKNSRETEFVRFSGPRKDYGDLFETLNIPRAQLERLKTPLSDRRRSMMDAVAVARDLGVDPREDPDQMRKIVATVQEQIDAEIKSTVGEQAYQEYRAFEQTAAARTIVQQLEQALERSGVPMSAAQSDQLASALAAHGTTSKPLESLSFWRGSPRPVPGH